MAYSIGERLQKATAIRDAMIDVLEGRATDKHNSYSIDDRSITKMTHDELQTAIDRQDAIVTRLERKFNRSRGRATSLRARF